MKETDVLGAKGKRCTVRLESWDDGEHAKTRLSALIRDRGGVKVTTLVFDTLDEALAYAQTLYQEAA